MVKVGFVLVPLAICALILLLAYQQWKTHNSADLQAKHNRTQAIQFAAAGRAQNALQFYDNKAPPVPLCTDSDSEEASEFSSPCRLRGFPDHTAFLPPFVSLFEHFKFNTKYKLATCIITGDYAAVASAAACFLENPTVFEKENATIGRTQCPDKPPFGLHSHEDIDLIDALEEDLTRWTIIANPTQRFLSAFLRHCVKKQCFTCKKNDMRCVLIGIEKRMTKLARGLKIQRAQLDLAFAPQSWFCSFDRHLRETKLVRMGIEDEFDDDQERLTQFLDDVLVEVSANRSIIHTLKQQIEETRLPNPRHYRRLRKKLFKDKQAKTRFLRIYQHDFAIFGYKTPLAGFRKRFNTWRARKNKEDQNNSENEVNKESGNDDDDDDDDEEEEEKGEEETGETGNMQKMQEEVTKPPTKPPDSK